MARKPFSLGRGLDALMGDPQDGRGSGGAEGSVRELDPAVLHPSPFQPRRDMQPELLAELVRSIEANGVLQPLLARQNPKKPGHYEIIAGERRFRAAKKAGLAKVPVLIRELSDQQAQTAALVENLQRADLNPLEEAEGLRKLLDDHQLTQEKLAHVVGKSRSHLANLLRLIHLPEEIRAHLRSGRLSAGHGRALLGHPDPLAALKTVLERGLNVRQTEQLALRALKPARIKRQPSAEIAGRLERLSKGLGMKVRVKEGTGRRPGGQLVVKFRNPGELEALLERLGGA